VVKTVPNVYISLRSRRVVESSLKATWRCFVSTSTMLIIF